jgi:hypothetical protein
VPDPTPTTPAGRWKAAALTHFKAMNSVLFPLVTAAQQWVAHKATDADVHALVGKDLGAVQETARELAAVRPYPAAPHALSDLQGSVTLYVASFQVLDAATQTTQPALRQQLSLAQQRLRLLGDRVFDQATSALQALDGPEREVEGTVVQKAAEVPDWRSLALEAGPPLHPKVERTVPRRTYQKTRPTTTLSAWRAAVAALQVPSGSAEAAALNTASAADLDRLSSRLEVASEQLWALPDPTGGRAESTRTQLSLLVHAEALRTAQVGLLTPPSTRGSLRAAADSTARVGDALWSGLLPPRTTTGDGSA